LDYNTISRGNKIL